MQLSPEKKIAGVLAPLFGLRGDDDLGIGDVAVLREFVDWTAEIGFKLVQLLPINETGGDHSPYNAISAMAIEPTTLYLAPGSPVELKRKDFDAVLADVDPSTGLRTNLAELRQNGVKYRRVKKLKRVLLEKAFAGFSAGATKDRQQLFHTFCAEEAAWLENYVLFRVLMEENGESEAWDHWPKEQQTIASARAWLDRQSPERQKQFRARADFFRYVQWIAHEQWSALRNYAEQRDVALMGDIPFGVSYYSADVFPGRANSCSTGAVARRRKRISKTTSSR